MNLENIRIKLRIVKAEDASALAEIYRYYVENTAVSFEYIPPDEEEFKRRIEEKIKSYPYIVAECDGVVVGYAYASRFLPRPAYIHSVETTVYVRKDFRGNKAGKSLYLALERLLKLQNVISLNACIACADIIDDTLNNDSMLFHSRMGYRYVGRFNSSGYKFSRFYDMIWMEKLISEPQCPCEEFVPFEMISKEADSILADCDNCL